MPGKLRRLIAAGAVVVGAAGCSGGSMNSHDVGGSTDAQGGSGAITVFAAAERHPVGDVSGTTLQGARLSLAAYRGKVVVVNFWSADCGPCHGEEPAFAELAKRLAPRGVQFVGIDERDNRAAALSFERKFHVSYPSLFDETDAYLLDFPGAVPSSTPTTIVIDRSGRIAAKVSGALDYTHLRALVNRVVTEAA